MLGGGGKALVVLIAADRAGVAQDALVHAGGRGDRHAGVIAVPGGRDHIGFVGGAAVRAGIGGVAVIGTGGRGDHAVAVAVAGGGDFLCIALGAALVGAGKGAHALFGAGGLGGHGAAVIIVAERRGHIGDIVGAAGAGMCGIAVGRAAGRCHRNLTVAVSGGRKGLGVGSAAAGAGKGFDARVRAGRVGGDHARVIAVPGGRDDIGPVGIPAPGAGIGGIPVFGAGGLGLHARAVAVPGGGDGFGIKRAAFGAGNGAHTVLRTGGRGGHRPGVVAVTGGKNVLCVGGPAAGAGEGNHPVFGAGGGLCHHTRVIAVQGELSVIGGAAFGAAVAADAADAVFAVGFTEHRLQLPHMRACAFVPAGRLRIGGFGLHRGGHGQNRECQQAGQYKGKNSFFHFFVPSFSEIFEAQHPSGRGRLRRKAAMTAPWVHLHVLLSTNRGGGMRAPSPKDLPDRRIAPYAAFLYRLIFDKYVYICQK